MVETIDEALRADGLITEDGVERLKAIRRADGDLGPSQGEGGAAFDRAISAGIDGLA